MNFAACSECAFQVVDCQGLCRYEGAVFGFLVRTLHPEQPRIAITIDAAIGIEQGLSMPLKLQVPYIAQAGAL
jgi:hypothetical protein